MKARLVGSIAGVVLIFGLLGCHRSGTWADDSNNWSRAFGSTKPTDVIVVHSTYWRSPHWTCEFQYFFHVEANSALHHQLFTENKLEKIEGPDAKSATKHFFGDKPDWFLPKQADKYEVWKYKDEPTGHFKVFVDTDNQDLFITDYQI